MGGGFGKPGRRASGKSVGRSKGSQSPTTSPETLAEAQGNGVSAAERRHRFPERANDADLGERHIGRCDLSVCTPHDPRLGARRAECTPIPMGRPCPIEVRRMSPFEPTKNSTACSGCRPQISRDPFISVSRTEAVTTNMRALDKSPHSTGITKSARCGTGCRSDDGIHKAGGGEVHRGHRGGGDQGPQEEGSPAGRGGGEQRGGTPPYSVA